MKRQMKLVGFAIDREHISRHSGTAFAHIMVRVLCGSVCYYDDHEARVVLTYRYQTDNGGNQSIWYGQSIGLGSDVEKTNDDVCAAAAIAKRIGDLDESGTMRRAEGPGPLVERLIKLKAKRMVYDGRECKYVFFQDVRSPSWKKWVADVPALRDPVYSGSLGVGAVWGQTVEEAKAALMVEVAKKTSEATLKMFLDEGCPVRMIYGPNEAPTLDSLEVALRPHFAPAPVLAVA
jgi:hypothetical protein